MSMDKQYTDIAPVFCDGVHIAWDKGSGSSPRYYETLPGGMLKAVICLSNPPVDIVRSEVMDKLNGVAPETIARKLALVNL